MMRSRAGRGVPVRRINVGSTQPGSRPSSPRSPSSSPTTRCSSARACARSSKASRDRRSCGEAGDGRAAIDLVRLVRPDVVLMDIQMPDIDGLEATRRLVATRCPSSGRGAHAHDLRPRRVRLRRAARGASGFLLKDTLPELLVAAIRASPVVTHSLSPGTTKRLIEAVRRTAPPRATRRRGLDELTPRERRGAHPRGQRSLQRARSPSELVLQPRDREDARQAAPGKSRPAAIACRRWCWPTRPAWCTPGASAARASRERPATPSG